MWQVYLAIGIIGVAALGVILLGLYLAAVKLGPARIIWDLLEIAAVRLLPKAVVVVTTRQTPENEAEWRHEELSGVKPPTTGVTTGTTVVQPSATRRNHPKP